MKKNLFGWLTMAAMLVGTGCSTDEVVNDYSPENAIQFGTYVGRDAQGRASAIDDVALKGFGKGFGVFAYHTSGDYAAATTPNFMYNQHVSYVSSAWTYSPVKYWPNNTSDKITFFAYAPYVETDDTDNFVFTANTLTGDPKITYTVTETVKNQDDLLWAVDSSNGLPFRNKVKQNTDIHFHFRHALSRIGFKAQVMVDNANQDATGEEDDATDASKAIATAQTTISISKVELIGKFHDSGVLNLNNTVSNEPSWEYLVTPAVDRIFTLNYSETESNSNFKNSVATKVTTSEQNLNADDSYIMVIPKKFDTDKVKIRVTYTVKTMDSNLEEGYSTVTNVIESSAFGCDFVAGNAYTFVLHLGLTSVKLSAEVEPWAVQTETAVNV